MKFRKDINGLRALAVIGVVLFHFNASLVPGGFAGVDIFFVISGFLMTGIIFSAIEEGNFSVFNFYVSRANRIIPPLAFLCSIILFLGWFFIPPIEYRMLGKHVATSLTFLSNVIFVTENGYFDVSSHEKWLLHTWSLSVEWQFYILYPLIIIFFKKFCSINTIKKLILVGTAVGFIFSIFATYKWPSPSYYLLPMRAWEMMVGGVAYLYPISIRSGNGKLLEWLGLTLIIGSYFLISSESLWPGFLAFFPVFGAFLLIQAQNNKSIVTGNLISQKIGLWSYSIYLWHWPIVVAIYTFYTLSINRPYFYIGIILSIFLGYLSYSYIEKINFLKYRNWNQIYRVKPVYLSLTIALLGAVTYINNGINSNIRRGANSEQAKFLNLYEVKHKNLNEAYWLKCNTYTSLTEKHTYSIDPVCITKQNEGGVFLWGDSHAEALSLGLRTLLKPYNIPFYQKTSAGCKASLNPSRNLIGDFKKSCDSSNQLAINSISKVQPKVVIIAQSGKHDETDWNSISQKLTGMGVNKIILVGPVPQWNPSLPKVIVKPDNWLTKEEFVEDSGLNEDIISLDETMKAKEMPPSVYYLSLIDKLCKKNNQLDNYACRAWAPNQIELLQVDYGHLSESGSIFVVNNAIKDKLLELYRN